jgi:RHS repeat-associated protein
MKFTVSRFFAAASIALPMAATAATGRTEGAFTVSPTGAAHYSIALWSPPGVRGIEPHLSLTYDSREGNGLFGVGWSLAGLSTIEHCNQTIAQDGVGGSPELDTSDRFCVDGNRLRLESPGSTYGADGTTYQTEIADFSRITSHGSGISSGGTGPSYFTVDLKNGLKYEYGHTTDSAIPAFGTASARLWALNRISDRSGNEMRFVYANDSVNGSYRISSIDYTYTNAASANYHVVFTYESRSSADGIWTYSIGGKDNEFNRISQISMKSGTATVKSYNLTYDNSPVTGRSRLKSVQECAASTSDCFQPTVVAYQTGQSGWGSEIPSSGSTAQGNVLQLDVNGDGLEDLVYPNASTSTFYYALGTASGTYSGPYNTGAASTNFGSAVPLDYNSDGRVDVLVPNAAGFWRVLSFQSAGATFTEAATSTPSTQAANGWVTAGDVNGDGRDDLIYVLSGGTGWATNDAVYARLNTGSGLSATATPLWTLSNSSALSPWTKVGVQPFGAMGYQFRSVVRRADFNGDGRADLLLLVKNCSADNRSQCGQAGTLQYVWQALLSRPNGAYSSLGIAGYAQAGAPTSPPLIGDFNGDRCSDLAFVSAGNWNIQYATCWRTGAASPFTTPVNTGVSVVGTNRLAMDWDGDGQDDLIQPDASGMWGYARATGSSLAPWTSLGFSNTSVTYLAASDVNGDGQPDLTFGNTSYVPTVRLHAGTKPDLATSFTDGFGVKVAATYAPITTNSYTKGSGATYPEQDVQSAIYVVSQVASSDGIGGTFTQNYSYAGARFNLQGRGFEGFQSRVVTDSRANAPVVRTFFKTGPYPLTGALDHEDVYQSNGTTPITSTTYTNGVAELDSTAGNKRYFVAPSAISTDTYEVGGSKNGSLITSASSTFQYDSYGNPTKTVSSVTDKDSAAPASPYNAQSWTTTLDTTFSSDTGPNWCLGLPTDSTVTYTASSGEPAVTRRVTYDVDALNCRIYRDTVEPTKSTYRVVRTFGFGDSFGNVTSVTVVGRKPDGADMAARTTALDWGTSGRFPERVTNPLSQTTTTEFDPGLGVPRKRSDANGIEMTWQYDDFGRKTLETRADGTSTAFAYNSCASSCVNPNNVMTVVATARNTDASILTDQLTYVDRFGRVLVTSQRMLAGGSYDRQELQYDAFGRAYRQGAPCVWGCTPYWTTIAYDAVGRPTQIQRPVSATDSTPQMSTISYAGRTTVVTDPQSRQTTRVTTVGGQLGQLKDHDNYAQNYSYDAFGSLLGVADNLGTQLFSATYDYGIRPFQRNATDVDLDVSAAAGQHRQYTFNALGELVGGSDAKSQSFSLTYDALSRPLVRTEQGFTTVWSWGSSAAAHNVGRLQSVSAASNEGTYRETYEYDTRGRPARQIISIPSDASYSYYFNYNTSTGLLDTLTYPAAPSTPLTLQYTYQNGILQRIVDRDRPTRQFWTVNQMNARGQVTQETLGNGVITNSAFDAVTGWLTSLQSGVGGGAALQNESYLYDLVGNVTQRQNGNVSLTESFCYDDLYRLDHSTLTGSCSSTPNLQLRYDPSGNITSRSDVANGATWTYDSNRKHAVVQAGSAAHSYSYDANGNALTRLGYTISWTSFNHPDSIASATDSIRFAYTQDHERWKSVYNDASETETTYFIGGLLEKVITPGATQYRHFILAGDTPIAVITRSAATAEVVRYLRGDHLGSVAAILNADGTSYVKESFTAFGKRRSSCTWSGPPTSGNLDAINAVTRHGYTWHTALGRMRLNDMNGRVQDALTGRFLSPDPVFDAQLGTQAFNRYAYVGNNPLTFADPSGFEIPAIDNPHVRPPYLAVQGGMGNLTFYNGTVGYAYRPHRKVLPRYPEPPEPQPQPSRPIPPSAPPAVPNLPTCGQACGAEGSIKGTLLSAWEAYKAYMSTPITRPFTHVVGVPYGGALYDLDGRVVSYEAPITKGDVIGDSLSFLSLVGSLSSAAFRASVIASEAVAAADATTVAGTAAKGFPDAALVVRGGKLANHTAEKINDAIARGQGGFSVQCDGGTCLTELSQFLKNPQVGTTTVGEIRRIGGNVIATPGYGHHATVTGVSGETMSPLLRVVPNPKPLVQP